MNTILRPKNTIGTIAVVALSVQVMALSGCPFPSVPTQPVDAGASSLPGPPVFVGDYLCQLKVDAASDNATANLSNNRGLAWIDFDDQGQLLKYEGVLPGFLELGTTQATIDLDTQAVIGTVTTPEGEEWALADLLSGLLAADDGTGTGFTVFYDDAEVSYDYSLHLDVSADADRGGFEGDAWVDRVTTENGAVVLDDAIAGEVRAAQRPADYERRSLPPPPRPISINAGVDCRMAIGDSMALKASAAGGVGELAYAWEPQETLSDPTILQPTARPSVTTTYRVTVADLSGALAFDEVTIEVDTTESIAATTFSKISYSFLSRGEWRAGADVPVFRDTSDDVEQLVWLPSEAELAKLEFAYYRPDGQPWDTPGGDVTVDPGGNLRIRHRVPVEELPCSGLWLTMATYDDEIVGGKRFVVERDFGCSSDILVVNADHDSPLLGLSAGADGKIKYYLGTRVESGAAGRIQAMLEILPDGTYVGYHFNSERQLVGLSADDLSYFKWTTDEAGVLELTAGRPGVAEWTTQLPYEPGREVGTAPVPAADHSRTRVDNSYTPRSVTPWSTVCRLIKRP